MPCLWLNGFIHRDILVTHELKQRVTRKILIWCKYWETASISLPVFTCKQICHISYLIALLTVLERVVFREALNIFKNNNEYGHYARQILGEGINRPKKGTDVGDHPPITPMKAATSIELDGDNWKIYDYIVRHFLGTVSYLFSKEILRFMNCIW